MGKKKMYKAITLITLLFLSACNRVPAGNVGVKVYLLGSNKGVDNEILSPGRYWIGWNEELYLFPTFSQTDTWGGQQALTFQTMEGLNVSADVGITYHINPTKISTVFQKYRKGIEEISDLYLRNMVRDALVVSASNRGIEMIYGKGKGELLNEVEAMVRKQVQDIGIEIENVYWVGNFNLPQAVVNSVNAKIAATQEAQQRENEVAKAKAEANIKIEQARGQAEYNLLIAKSEADALKIRGEALKANTDLISLNAIEKWNGVLPLYNGAGAVPFVNLEARK
jgi:regulator of protease activity HflC (stomatin/prohibitin superfamily)